METVLACNLNFRALFFLEYLIKFCNFFFNIYVSFGMYLIHTHMHSHIHTETKILLFAFWGMGTFEKNKFLKTIGKS